SRTNGGATFTDSSASRSPPKSSSSRKLKSDDAGSRTGVDASGDRPLPLPVRGTLALKDGRPMPTLNQKLFLRLIAVVVVLGGRLAVLHPAQSRRVPDAPLWQANAAAEKGKTDKAIAYMKQSLEFRPDDYDTAIKLADLMVERAVSTRDLSNAQFLYERVLREAPGRADVGRKLVTLCLRLGRHADALTHAERLLKDAPTDGVLLGQVAECYLAQNRPVEARASLEKAIAHAPENVRAYDLLARLLSRLLNKPQDAQAVLDRLVQANPGEAEAFLVRARFLKQENRPEE